VWESRFGGLLPASRPPSEMLCMVGLGVEDPLMPEGVGVGWVCGRSFVVVG